MRNRYIKITLFLISISIVLYGMDYYIFHELRNLFFYLIGDIAFIPLQVLIVTLVFDRILERREKQDRMKKLNMLIGLFFQEIGLLLLKNFARTDPKHSDLLHHCKLTADTSDKDFKRLEQELNKRDKQITIEQIDLEALTEVLSQQKGLLINLIANPSLLEHESFSELLMAVSHLNEELQLRKKICQKYPNYDNSEHLKVDIERVYGHLMVQWLSYIQHLKSDYPFLYTTAMITNPFESKELLLMEREVRPE